MSVLLDTNILTRSAQPAHPMHASTLNAVSTLRMRGEDLVIVPQNLVEFWAVATRPLSVNGLGMTVAQTRTELAIIKGLFLFLPDNPLVHDEWEQLVARHDVSGKNTYDARLVAAMSAHHIVGLLTFNGLDFKRFSWITLISPADFS